MSFNSIQFLLFFPIVAIFYFAIPHKVRLVWLLIASYFFYMCWNPKYVLLIATSTIITYVGGLLMGKAKEIKDEKQSIKISKLLLFLSIFSNLGILFMFKYYNFFSTILKELFSYFHISINMPLFDHLLPIGISFYTFQALSYVIDDYRNDVKVERNLVKYALFVSIFPQLIAGPIQKSKNYLHQIDEKHHFDYDRVKNGLLLMLWGYFQKVIIADRLGQFVNTVFDNPAKYKGFEVIIAVVFYAFQIYCDFSSLSDIAVGAAEVMGFKLSKNFERPYFSKSIKEFWTRWHMSLTYWFMDYLYFPLGGSRCSKLRTYFNVMVVFVVSGLWHGAALTFVIWGALHGIYHITGNLLKPIKKNFIKTLKIKTNVFSYKLIQVLITFALVDFAWIFFRANSFKDAITLIRNMTYFNPWVFTDGSIYKLGLDPLNFLVALLGICAILAVNLLQRTRNLRSELCRKNMEFRWFVYLTFVVGILMLGIYGDQYAPQNFIYTQF